MLTFTQKSATCHTHFCVASTGISAARTTLLLNAAPSSRMSCASAVSPLTISHLGESGIHLRQLYVFVFIFGVTKTLSTQCHSSCTACFGRFGCLSSGGFYKKRGNIYRGVCASQATCDCTHCCASHKQGTYL